MKNKLPEKVNTAIIGGTGFESLFEEAKKIHVGTPYGIPPPIQIGVANSVKIAFLPRHGYTHAVPPHKVNYRANIYALHKIGVERVLATNAVGAINLKFKPGDIAVPHDLVDLTKNRPSTFYDEAAVVHIDFTEPYCPQIRKALIQKAKENTPNVWERAVYVCTEGPRFETPAEIRMFRTLGFDIVGMTGAPEATLARELGMCYASLCFVSNMAAGITKKLSAREITETSKLIMPKIRKILIEAVSYLPKARSCSCATSIVESRTEETRQC
ncbi:S-methyl-5'-thioadenosine phosphorylase [Candidatus Bathyarchaeota archaeon]|nr:MAG: S-methyl-5'-thioadenosine phosphorylase [Candidatus Bathyarchaeota archaeon]